MTASCKQIITRPSLSSTFWFELMPNSDIDYSVVTDNLTTNTHWISPNVDSVMVDPVPTWSEYIARRSELVEARPDLVDIIDDYMAFGIGVSDPTPEELAEFGLTNGIGWHIFNTTYTIEHTANTWDELISAYISESTDEKVATVKEKLAVSGNTLTEEFYIDGVKQEYIGKF